MSLATAQFGLRKGPGPKKGSGPFCRNGPSGALHKRVLTPFSSRRGTVLIMVVGVLAMLFIVGSTLIIVARFERQTSDKLTAGQNMDAIFQAVMQPIQSQLREDVVGIDDIPYNRAWNVAETSQIEDAADFPGVAGTASTDAEKMRSGDLLLSSSEPVIGAGGNWFWPWMSSGLDVVPAGYAANLSAMRNLPVDQTHGAWRDMKPNHWFDADGDGLSDMGNSGILAQTANMFGPGYLVGQRVLAHGGMVLIDPFTHPLLLAQVIHPEDTVYHNDPSRLWSVNPGLTVSSADEGGLRRRFILPKNLGSDLSALPDTDLRKKLPVTTGYEAASGADQNIIKDLTPHWWPVDSSIPGLANDAKWWKAILTPPALGLTEAGYNAARDTYSRRQLITTANSDDLLRPLRDEGRFYDRLGELPSGTNIYALYAQLYRAANADAAGGTDTYGLSKFPVYAYGREPVGGKLAFNVDGLRTAFSLRDVLGVAWNPATPGFEYDVGSAHPAIVSTQARALQLTAYFLAMIQHSSVPGSDRPNPSEAELAEQLKTAAQLAVNAIDYADADNVPTCLTFNWIDSAAVPQRLQVFGYEKQPFITEAYAKVVQAANSTGSGWVETPLDPQSIFAIELYNPYPNDMLLTGYRIKTNLATIDLTGITIKGYSYIVLASRYDDALLSAGAPLFPGANSTSTDQNFYYHNGTPDATNDEGGLNLGSLVTGLFEFQPMTGAGDPLDPIRLVRTNTWDLMGNVPGPEIEVDRIETADLRFAEQNIDGARNPSGIGDFLVRDRSLMRHKEDHPVGTQYPPRHWHFTLSQQLVMPPVEYEETPVIVPPSSSTTVLTTEKDRPAQHNLLLSDRMFVTSRTDKPVASSSYMPNYKVVETYFLGINLDNWKPFAPSGAGQPQYDQFVFSNGVNPSNPPIAPFQLVTSDAGVHSVTGGTLAFPTTGALLLVPRYAHEAVYTYDVGAGDFDPPTYIPMSVAATRAVWIDGNPHPGTAPSAQQMWMVDNGRIPVFDPNQICRDLLNPNNVVPGGPQGRFSGPWGQLIYDYFTALPLDELFRPIPKAALAGTGVPDLDTNFAFPLADTQNVPADAYEKAYGALFGWYPLIDRVADAPSAIGARVLGRINLNFAPWWVLDGLPALPNGLPNTLDSIPKNTNYVLAGVPLREILSGLPGNSGYWGILDPPEYLNPASKHDPAACVLLGPSVNGPALATDQKPLFDPGKPDGDPRVAHWLPSVSPTFAKYMVSYREEGRSVDGLQVAHDQPGFVSVGNLADVIQNMPAPLINTLTDGSVSYQLPDATFKTLEQVRAYTYRATSGNDNTYVKPYAYLGYLQMVAPLVRLQDWVTVKNHVFTIYATVGDTSDTQMPIWMRSQLTVDRTNCLYQAGELPRKIIETPAIAYQNAVDDK